ncbi:MAG: hypothetical protein HY397_00480 [Candidatus Doudnabacteria bacterium]|nr:hypothetical protein [Candidatus Doudnabacteria bacterium]
MQSYTKKLILVPFGVRVNPAFLEILARAQQPEGNDIPAPERFRQRFTGWLYASIVVNLAFSLLVLSLVNHLPVELPTVAKLALNGFCALVLAGSCALLIVLCDPGKRQDGEKSPVSNR